MFKIDLAHYFCQLPIDPSNFSVLCFVWDNQFYFDIMSQQGLHSAPYFAQRTSNSIRYIHNSMDYYLFNYMDDFLGAELWQKIWRSFLKLQCTLHDIGVKQSEEKCVEPTKVTNCPGNQVNAEEQTISVLPDRLEQIVDKVTMWEDRKIITKKELQCIMGRLNFVCHCIRPGHIFMARMLNCLQDMGKKTKIAIPEQMKKDLVCWKIFPPHLLR